MLVVTGSPMHPRPLHIMNGTTSMYYDRKKKNPSFLTWGAPDSSQNKFDQMCTNNPRGGSMANKYCAAKHGMIANKLLIPPCSLPDLALSCRRLTISLRPSLVSPFLSPKNDVFRSQNRFATVVDPKPVIFQASVFGCRFRDGRHTELRVQFRIKSHPKISSRLASGWVSIRRGEQQAT